MNKIQKITSNIDGRKEVLEKIIKYIQNPNGFFHIVSLNPENLVIAVEDEEFEKIATTAQIRIADGIGTVLAAQILSGRAQERLAGVDLMKELCDVANTRSMTVVLIGGKANLAESLAKCQKKIYPSVNFYGLQGFKDIQNPKEEEKKHVKSIVVGMKPSFIFAAFGSPAQEKWFFRNQAQFEGAVCMGVGGSFDFLVGEVPRAPLFMRKAGFEWLYRLVRQPWRIKRQLRLLKFIYLVLKEKVQRS